MTKSIYIVTLAAIILATGLGLFHLFTSKEHSPGSSEKELSAIAIFDTVKQGRVDTVKQLVSIRGKRKFARALNHPKVAKCPTSDQQIPEREDDSLHCYATTIRDSGLVMDIEIISQFDGLPLEVLYSGTVDRLTVQKCDTLMRVIEKTLYERPSWYNTFSAGAAVAVVVLAVFLLVLK